VKKLFLLALASLWCGHAAAATYSVPCNGCSEDAMLQAASRATTKGIVYVFNAPNNKSRKYTVQTEIISLRPYWAFTWAEELPVESDVKSAFSKFVTVQNAFEEEESILLPPDFPIRSVAGAMLDPGAATVRITDFVRNQPAFKDLSLTVTALVTAILKKNIPFLNISDYLKVTKLIVEFADGSTMEFDVFFSNNVLSGQAVLELKIIGNARMEDGSPAPTSSFGFRNFLYDDTGNAINEWVLWASSRGVPVYDQAFGGGTSMTCTVEGTVISCIVHKKTS